MNKKQQLEQLSACMDDEVTEEEMASVFAFMQEYPELIEVWQRYHFIQATLQNEINSHPDIQQELKKLHNAQQPNQLKKNHHKNEKHTSVVTDASSELID